MSGVNLFIGFLSGRISTTKMSSAAVNMKMLSGMQRKGDVYRGNAVGEDGEVVDVLIEVKVATEQILSRLEVQKFVKVLVVEQYLNARAVKVVKLNAKSRVFVTCPFAIPEDFEKNYYDAPVVSICDTLASKRNRRVSVKGTVENVSPIREGDKWRRRDVDIVDGETRSKIRVKLWGDHADIYPTLDDTVVIKNVVTDTFNNRVCVEATSETSFAVVECTDLLEKDVAITGFMAAEEPVELVTTKNKVLYVAKSILEECIGGDVTDLEQLLPFQCTVGYYMRARDVVVTMTATLDAEGASTKP